MSQEKKLNRVGTKMTDLYKEYSKLWDAAHGEDIVTTASAAKSKAADAAVMSAGSLVGTLDKAADNIQSTLSAIAKMASDYADLVDAITVKRAELKDIHGIEAEANSATELVSAKFKVLDDMQAEADRIMVNAREHAEEVIANAKDQAFKTVNAAEEDKLALDQENKRRTEQFNYDFEREAKAKSDKLQDELNLRIREIDEREEEVSEREAVANDKDKEIETLEGTLEEAELAISAAVDAAIAEEKESASKSKAIGDGFSKRAHENALAMKDVEIKSLRERTDDLENRLDAANAVIATAQSSVSEMAIASLSAQGDAATIAKTAEIAAGRANK